MLQWLVAVSRGVLSGSSLEGSGSDEDVSEQEEEEEDEDEDSCASFLPGAVSLAASLTHVIIDEVHERGIDTDMVLLVLRLLLLSSFRRQAAALRNYSKSLLASDGSLSRSSDDYREAMLLFARRIHARRLRLILMSATFDTSMFVAYFSGLCDSLASCLCSELGLDTARSHSYSYERNVIAAAHEAAQRGVAALSSPYPRGLGLPQGGGARDAFLEVLAEDAVPVTLYVGAKRYPVAEVWLEDMCGPGSLLSGPDLASLRSTVQRFDDAASQWGARAEFERLKARAAARAAGGKHAHNGKGAPPPPTVSAPASLAVGDALTLNDRSSIALRRLAVRIVLSLARPGDAILIFVAGMADIDAVVECFQVGSDGQRGAGRRVGLRVVVIRVIILMFRAVGNGSRDRCCAHCQARDSSGRFRRS
jgi:hypothetical protein